jgi:hypothetical protein
MRIAKDKGVWSGVEAAGIGRKVADVRTRHKPSSVGGALTVAQGPASVPAPVRGPEDPSPEQREAVDLLGVSPVGR